MPASAEPKTLPALRLTAPLLVSRADTPSMLSTVARLVASGVAETKSGLVEITGLARSTVSTYVDMLLRRGVFESAGTLGHGGRGRPAKRLTLSGRAGLVLAVDIGARHTQLAVSELNQRVLARTAFRMDVRDGPERVLASIGDTLQTFLDELGPLRPVRCAVIGVPARVGTSSGTLVRPNIMPGWHAYPLAETFVRRFGGTAILENDVNLRAIGEAAVLGPDQRPILAIKVAIGVGAGIVDAHGNIFHGFDGAAGDLGHVPVRGASDIACTCGMVGCVEAVVSVPSILRRLRTEHPHLLCEDEDEIDQLMNLLRRGEPATIQVVRSAAETLGEAVAMMCNTLNPRRIVLGGDITTATDEVLAGVRAVVYQIARPLATRNLVIGHSVLGEQAGLAGALVLGIENALSPESLRSIMH